MIALRSIFLLLAATALIGCEEDLAARDHFETPFSVYGVLSPQLSQQSLRVYPIEDFPTLGSPTIDALVTSKDLTTGETRTWTDSVTIDANGQYEHTFWSPFRAEYGHIYHVEVTRSSDGAKSYADVRVPVPVAVHLLNTDDPHLQVLVEGEGIRALTPDVEYTVKGGDDPRYQIHSYTVSYEAKERKVAQGWQVTINMVLDRPLVQGWYTYDFGFDGDSAVLCPLLSLHGLKVRVLIGDSVWNPPEGRFDPKILSQPGVLSNVKNGFGFIGGGYRIDVGLLPSRKAIEDACFIYYDPTL